MNMGNVYGFPNINFNSIGRSDNSDLPDIAGNSSSSDSEDDNDIDSNLYSNQYDNSLQSGIIKFSSNSKITLEHVIKIESDLEFYEIISLLFLLYDTNIALQEIRTSIDTYFLFGPKCVTNDKLTKWVRSQPNNWKMKLVEALAIIKNYKVLRKLGYNKIEVDNWSFPTKDTSLYIDRTKKMLYLICECLSNDQAKKLISLVGSDKTFEYDINSNRDPIFLEYYILFWMSQDYLTVPNKSDICLKNLTKHLKVIGFFDEVQAIDSMVKSINNERGIKTVENKSSRSNKNMYEIINPDNVGLNIIINMDKFRSNVEKRDEFKHLLSSEPLNDRQGSLKDVEKLIKTFNQIKFKVVEVHNICHDELKQEIQKLITKHFDPKVHSILFLCILSHGSEGTIYAANGIPVSIRDIQDTISGISPVADLLIDKPKVIIIQACQGKSLLYADQNLTLGKQINYKDILNNLKTDGQMENSDLCLDGPEKYTPKLRDILTCMAIVEGYAAVRGCIRGSRYIQELCDCILKYYKTEHFVDIVTRVQEKLNAEVMHVTAPTPELSNCTMHPSCACISMTPVQYTTLQRSLYLA